MTSSCLALSSGNAAEAVYDLGSEEGRDRATQELICELRSRSRDLREILAPLIRIPFDASSPESSWRALQQRCRLLLDVLAQRYGPLDQAVRESTIAFAEIDNNGVISYANKALLDLVPDATGRSFASLFGKRGQEVADALANGARTSKRLELYRGQRQPICQLRAELNPITDERGRRGAIAILLDVRDEERRYDAAPYGIVRVDSSGAILFANARAAKLICMSRAELVGESIDTFFGVCSSDSRSFSLDELLVQEETPRVFELRPSAGQPVPVRVSVMPWFDSAEQRIGSLLLFRPIVHEIVASELTQLLSSQLEPEELVRGIMRVVQRVVPHDMAIFGLYSEDMRYFRKIVVEPRPDWFWSTRWFQLTPEARKWLTEGKTWCPRLVDATRELAPELETNLVNQELVKQGLKGLMLLPVSGDSGHYRAGLTLLSKEEDCYDGADLSKLRDLGVDRALSVAEAAFARRREERFRELKAKLGSATSESDFAEYLALGIADSFGWTCVSVFRVDYDKPIFRLFRQIDRSPHAHPLLPTEYEHPFKYLLGTALRTGRVQYIADTDKASEEEYRPLFRRHVSALAAPLRVCGRVEWIVAIESDERNAFDGPDRRSLDDLLEQSQAALNERSLRAVNTALLDTAEQAVVVVDAAGLIVDVNVRALTLFCRERCELQGTPLSSYGNGPDDRALLSECERKVVEQDHLTLCLGEGVFVPILATKRNVNDVYGRRLWLLSDLRERNWHGDRRYLEETVREVAQNVRLPLLTAGGLLRSAIKKIRNPAVIEGCASSVEQAARYLGKVDITYERLANTLTIREGPNNPPQDFDALLVLRDAIGAFPTEDEKLIEIKGVDAVRRFAILGWPEQLAFAFRSLIGFLLLRLPREGRLAIGANTDARENLTLEFTGPACSADFSSATKVAFERTLDDDPIAAAELDARRNAALAPDSVRLAVELNKGSLDVVSCLGGLRVVITLPGAHSTRRVNSRVKK
jgi:PAS domain S-box-containing protein